ncbi:MULTISPECIES: hypothetical protein [unclassified Streptomyces]|uniref:hypothetical protein n=1 Tax=unclassified Streptomyces TaxID=2593676 RepID=UPI00081B025B|nr:MULTISPECIES: hypothetical protein [unclassified Streptomyces]SCE54561.1 hypothetical protein GA0115234_110987 [Streptomyces sp. DvalAA-43]
MRTGRTGTVAALAGTLALAAFTAPAAEAADTGITVSKMVVNSGKPIVVGTTEKKHPSVRFHVSWSAGHSLSDVDANPYLYHGTTARKGADHGGIYLGSMTCYEDGSRAADCTGDLYIEPRYTLDSNNDATTWKVGAAARIWGANGQPKSEDYLPALATAQVKRAARATVNASPEPVTKGKTLTVTGRLTRADWVKHSYAGYGGKAAKLQFRKAGSSTYTTVKIVKADSTGSLRTTVKAASDGYWRWTFGETSTTGGATAAGDYVDVK